MDHNNNTNEQSFQPMLDDEHWYNGSNGVGSTNAALGWNSSMFGHDEKEEDEQPFISNTTMMQNGQDDGALSFDNKDYDHHYERRQQEQEAGEYSEGYNTGVNAFVTENTQEFDNTMEEPLQINNEENNSVRDTYVDQDATMEEEPPHSSYERHFDFMGSETRGENNIHAATSTTTANSHLTTSKESANSTTVEDQPFTSSFSLNSSSSRPLSDRGSSFFDRSKASSSTTTFARSSQAPFSFSSSSFPSRQPTSVAASGLSAQSQSIFDRIQERVIKLQEEQKAREEAQQMLDTLQVQHREKQQQRACLEAELHGYELQRYTVLNDCHNKQKQVQKEKKKCKKLEKEITKIKNEMEQEHDRQERFMLYAPRRSDGTDTDDGQEAVRPNPMLNHVIHRRLFIEALEVRIKAHEWSRQKRARRMECLEQEIRRIQQEAKPRALATLERLHLQERAQQQEKVRLVQTVIPETSQKVRQALADRGHLRQKLAKEQKEHDFAQTLLEQAERQYLQKRPNQT